MLCCMLWSTRASTSVKNFAARCSRLYNLLHDQPRPYSYKNNYHNLTSLSRGAGTRSRNPIHLFAEGTIGLRRSSSFFGIQFHRRIIINGQCYFPRKDLQRFLQTHQRQSKRSNKTVAIYTVSMVMVVLGVSYAAVPLYRLYCQATGYAGTTKQVDVGENIENMERIPDRKLTIKFNADTGASMRWDFKPQQKEIKIVPGETALAFYTATNPTDKAVVGISTYNVIPFDAGQYFNKIQCFCFEEQRLNPHEQVDMPVFFYIDPEFNDDPAMAKVNTIILSYTFFQAKDGASLPFSLHK